MKVKDIARQHGLDALAFADWLKQSGYKCTSSLMGGLEVREGQDANEIANAFKAFEAKASRVAQEAAAQEAAAARQKQQALASMLITSGFNFDGYTITKYSGYISGDDAVNVPRNWWGASESVADKLMASLVTIRRNALAELKEAAYALGCNAVIGVDFDYLTLDPQHGQAFNTQGTIYEPYVFGVTANGNAVIIERNES